MTHPCACVLSRWLLIIVAVAAVFRSNHVTKECDPTIQPGGMCACTARAHPETRTTSSAPDCYVDPSHIP